MTININQMLTGRTSQLENAGNHKKPEATSARQSGSSAVPAQDAVSLTAEARKLTQMSKQADKAPVSNDAKIARLREAINDGSYKVDADKLAQKMTDFESQLNNALDG